jgi:Flp pilus assembly protein TadG
MKCRGDRGAAAVEFALVLPFLLLLVCGLIDFGRAYNAKLTLTHAAREGVRVWALTKDTDKAGATTRAAAVGLDPLTVTTTSCDMGKATTLSVAYDFSYITPLSGLMSLFPGGSTLTNPVRLTSNGVMRCAG